MQDKISKLITFDDFLNVDIRCGTIVKAEPFVEAKKPAYKLLIDFGSEIGLKKSSAQITEHHEVASLVGMQVLAVINFPPKQIGPFMSEVLTLGLSDDQGKVSLIGPKKQVPNGKRLF